MCMYMCINYIYVYMWSYLQRAGSCIFLYKLAKSAALLWADLDALLGSFGSLLELCWSLMGTCGSHSTVKRFDHMLLFNRV